MNEPFPPSNLSLSLLMSSCFKKILCLSMLPGGQTTAAIAGGVAAGAALLFAVPAIAFAWWLRRKPQDHFFDVPG